MELNGEQLIAASVPDVWRGLNDVAILGKAIPGCEAIERISPEEVHAKVMFKIGPVRARFAGKLFFPMWSMKNHARWLLKARVAQLVLLRGVRGLSSALRKAAP